MFKYKGWEFQEDIPKLHSEYRASIPGNWEYNIKLIGGKRLTTNTSEIKKNCLEYGNGSIAHCGEYLHIMKNIPAFIEEDYMSSKDNYLARIEYELKTFRGFDGGIKNYTKSWKTVDKEFKTDKSIGRQLTKSINLENHISNAIINEQDPLKKAKAIYKYVQEEYSWNGDYKIFKDVSVKNLIKNKSGNVSSLNILLHNLLKESNIDVKPLLVSTRNNGFPTKIYPVISGFNYLVVQATINNKDYLLDATDTYLSFGEIPFRCLNSYGRLMDFKNGSEWLDIAPKKPSLTQHRVELKIDKDEVIIGTISSKTTGYHALRNRKKYYQNEDSYISNLEDKYPNIEIDNHKIIKGGKTNPEFVESYNIEYNYEETGDNIYLNPFLITLFTENPFKLQERTYPIDFGYKDTFYYISKLDIGNEYSVLEKPKDLKISLPNKKGDILFSSTINGNIVNTFLKITFKDSIYAPEYYLYLKEFMNRVINIQTNSIIVLKKK